MPFEAGVLGLSGCLTHSWRLLGKLLGHACDTHKVLKALVLGLVQSRVIDDIPHEQLARLVRWRVVPRDLRLLWLATLQATLSNLDRCSVRVVLQPGVLLEVHRASQLALLLLGRRARLGDNRAVDRRVANYLMRCPHSLRGSLQWVLLLGDGARGNLVAYLCFLEGAGATW